MIPIMIPVKYNNSSFSLRVALFLTNLPAINIYNIGNNVAIDMVIRITMSMATLLPILYMLIAGKFVRNSATLRENELLLYFTGIIIGIITHKLLFYGLWLQQTTEITSSIVQKYQTCF